MVERESTCGKGCAPGVSIFRAVLPVVDGFYCVAAPKSATERRVAALEAQRSKLAAFEVPPRDTKIALVSGGGGFSGSGSGSPTVDASAGAGAGAGAGAAAGAGAGAGSDSAAAPVVGDGSLVAEAMRARQEAMKRAEVCPRL